MPDHNGRRRLLYSAVTVLEPYACSGLVQHYVARRYKLILPLLRIYVDLERLTRAGHLVRYIRPRLEGDGTTFFWETLGLTLVEPERPSPRNFAAAARMTTSVPKRLEAVAGGSGYEITLPRSRQAGTDPFTAFWPQ